jgi:hypothetical protein
MRGVGSPTREVAPLDSRVAQVAGVEVAGVEVAGVEVAGVELTGVGERCAPPGTPGAGRGGFGRAIRVIDGRSWGSRSWAASGLTVRARSPRRGVPQDALQAVLAALAALAVVGGPARPIPRGVPARNVDVGGARRRVEGFIWDAAPLAVADDEGIRPV